LFGQSTKVRVAVSWFFIIGTVILLQIPIYRNMRLPSQDSTPDLQLQITGKYFIGMKHLFGQQLLQKKLLTQLEHNFQKYQGTKKSLSHIPILAELSGRDAALLELKRIAKDSGSAGIVRDLPLFQQLYLERNTLLDSRQQLALKRYGWIGQLALSQNKPDSDPERKAVLQSAVRMVILMVMLMMGILITVGAGMILLTIAIVLRKRGKLPSRLTMPEIPNNALLEGFAIYLTGFIALPTLIQALFPGFRIGAILLAVFAVIMAILWPRFRGSNWKNYREALGWHRGRGLFREVGAGIVGYITGLPLLLGAAVLVMTLSQYAGKTPVHPIVNEVSRGPLHMLMWGLMACIWAPIVEETFFRGVLFGYFRRHLAWATSSMITGFIFAIIHPQGWIALPALAVIGFNLSVIREWRGSIIASISAHALNNGSALLLLILTLS
jgi:membrane protease YdiL (CAAX protease family)